MSRLNTLCALSYIDISNFCCFEIGCCWQAHRRKAGPKRVPLPAPQAVPEPFKIKQVVKADRPAWATRGQRLAKHPSEALTIDEP